MWNYKCDRCGCALDPGERCDCGAPYSHQEDPNSGKWLPVFATFKRITYAGENSIWQFCGYCFAGENTERGKDPVYV